MWAGLLKGIMDTLQLTTSTKRINITDETGAQRGVLQFNPKDLLFAEKFYQLLDELRSKGKELNARAAELDANDETDENGIPVNAGERISFMRETCDYMREKVDGLFGAGTSTMCFGECRDIEAIQQLFEGLLPFFQEARAEQVKKYSPKPPKRAKP